MRIYVAGPYTAPTLALIQTNVLHALDAGVAVMALGHEAYVPHLTHWLDQHAKKRGIELPNTYWYVYDAPHLAVCDGLYRLPGPSTGADGERLWMERAGRPVWDRLEDIPPGDPDAHPEEAIEADRVSRALDVALDVIGQHQGQTALHAFLAGMIYMAVLQLDPRVAQMARALLTADLSQNHQLNELVRDTGQRTGSRILARGIPV